MQAIWSRVAQYPSCGCGAGVRAASKQIVTRRTAATARLRHKVRFADVLTAMYTTILGTAAFADTERKRSQTRDLDEQLSIAKQDLEQLVERADTTPRLDPEFRARPAIKKWRRSYAYQHFRNIAKFNPRMDPFHDAEAARLGQEQRLLGDHLAQICLHPRRIRTNVVHNDVRRRTIHAFLYDIPAYYRAWAAEQEADQHVLQPAEYRLMMERLRAEEQDPFYQHREATETHHLHFMSEVTRDIVERLLLLAFKMPDSTLADENLDGRAYKACEGEQEQKTRRFEEVMKGISSLQGENYPKLRVALEYPDECRQAREELSKSIISILWDNAETARRYPQEAVAKICFNILISPFPLSIHNINYLLLSFINLGWYALANKLDKQLHRTKLRRTTETLVLRMHLYRAKDNVFHFYKVVAELLGVVRKGAGIRRIHTSQLRSYLYKRWTLYNDVGISSYYIRQRCPRDENVYNAMMEGTLHFQQIQHAVHVFSNALYQGCRPSYELILRLLDACVASVDRAAALFIVKVFTHCYTALQSMGVMELRELSEKFFAVLALIGLRPNHRRPPKELALIGINLTGYRLLSLSLIVNSVMRKVERLLATTYKLMEMFELVPKQESAELVLTPSSGVPDRYKRDLNDPHWYNGLDDILEQLGSNIGMWVDEDLSALELYGGLVEEVHKASVKTARLVNSFRYLLPRQYWTALKRRRAFQLVYQDSTTGWLYDHENIKECIGMIRQESPFWERLRAYQDAVDAAEAARALDYMKQDQERQKIIEEEREQKRRKGEEDMAVNKRMQLLEEKRAAAAERRLKGRAKRKAKKKDEVVLNKEHSFDSQFVEAM
ncbi:hypothetical protein MKZ38_000994 [Zalerion maritima]|uniref:Uncharacterized protein n=1 Tax=Zalerion maritima TaxID=339359 RepID=A0AAD5RQT8_9PEZI|nr:hypothetical protein MKZ38_000994 [Zalerion maritima]